MVRNYGTVLTYVGRIEIIMSLIKEFHSFSLSLKNEIKIAVSQSLPHMRPRAICLGAQKAGTSALYDYLSIHPQVVPSIIKEIDFFNCDSRYARGNKFYHMHFPFKTPSNIGKATFDITPGYLGAASKAAQRIYDYNSKMKLIVLLRNPITRAFSAWQMYRRYLLSNPAWFYEWIHRCDDTVDYKSFVRRPSSFGNDFTQDIANEISVIEQGRTIEMPILSLGIYHIHLSYYFSLFPLNQILILSSEEMLKDTIGHLRLIEAFVEISKHSWSREKTRPRFTGGYKESVPGKAIALLNSFYQEHNLVLFTMLQREFAWGRE
jgi:hypothetical protein